MRNWIHLILAFVGILAIAVGFARIGFMPAEPGLAYALGYMMVVAGFGLTSLTLSQLK